MHEQDVTIAQHRSSVCEPACNAAATTSLSHPPRYQFPPLSDPRNPAPEKYPGATTFKQLLSHDREVPYLPPKTVKYEEAETRRPVRIAKVTVRDLGDRGSSRVVGLSKEVKICVNPISLVRVH